MFFLLIVIAIVIVIPSFLGYISGSLIVGMVFLLVILMPVFVCERIDVQSAVVKEMDLRYLMQLQGIFVAFFTWALLSPATLTEVGYHERLWWVLYVGAVLIYLWTVRVYRRAKTAP